MPPSQEASIWPPRAIPRQGLWPRSRSSININRDDQKASPHGYHRLLALWPQEASADQLRDGALSSRAVKIEETTSE